ncbi:MAG TPA: ferrous iron transport protein B [Candidatus Pullichristensenella excrementigallinarum]|uniref:Ferrous iron transport protein B n=1 Tax=Candidatus Pullichristensenella excrementigallinarum TaxID=2840907 RepID=A0A9D1LD12_9FIRM|nr:ferrous iron transport protein B [Candidatus Pullichristensenella excrementigallinarum]
MKSMRGEAQCVSPEALRECLREGDLVVALAGNPNVGKSTVFNQLTGMRQHTGNWPGKTVLSAWGRCAFGGKNYVLVDTPGAYSLSARSAEEEAARDFICFGEADAVVVVCDATCLERNLHLILQIMEVTDRVAVCVNLLDEAGKKHIRVDLEALERELGVPVVGSAARSGKGIDAILQAADRAMRGEGHPRLPRYSAALESAIAPLEEELTRLGLALRPRWLACRLLEGDREWLARIEAFLGDSVEKLPGIAAILEKAPRSISNPREEMVQCLYRRAEEIVHACVFEQGDASRRQARWDKILTSRKTGIPIMLLTLAVVFYITILGANYPSEVLSGMFARLEEGFAGMLASLNAPNWVIGLLAEGMLRVLGWVVSVMLPPMAIFFPLFTLLEDLGYLPRVAFNLDRCFQRCRACGKQCLTMCLGFGCNAAGVVGCRIIDSRRERLIAILTNSLVPCNGRFPMMISLIGVFFVGGGALFGGAVLSAAALTGVILLGIAMTFLASRLLSATLLKGVPSSFTLELPPFRAPRVGHVIVRSVLDRTLFVLGRAVAIAAPAGLIIWTLANASIEGKTLLSYATDFLQPVGRLMGLDGVILMAFILGLPANEIVLPLAVMAYTAGGGLVEMENMGALKNVLVANGWTWLTALNAVLFSLMHWPCSTTLITIYKETRRGYWTLVAFLLPTMLGFLCCLFTATLARIAGLA